MSIKQTKINNCLRLVSSAYKLVPNVVKPHTGNSDEHEMAKFKLALYLMKEGKEVYTEVIFKNGGRADILVPEDFRVYEVRHSETDKESLHKETLYPIEVEILYLESEVILNDKFIL